VSSQPDPLSSVDAADVDDEVVDEDVEHLGRAHEGVGRRRDGPARLARRLVDVDVTGAEAVHLHKIIPLQSTSSSW
jgi:hypothetical protein